MRRVHCQLFLFVLGFGFCSVPVIASQAQALASPRGISANVANHQAPATDLSSVPPGAQGAISTALGRDDSAQVSGSRGLGAWNFLRALFRDFLS